MKTVVLKGFCPTLNKEMEISAPLFDEALHQIGRVECEHLHSFGECNFQKCPIVEQNGYRYH